MDGVHDLGGMDGFGAVEVEFDEPVFHEPWEGRVWALSTAMSTRGVWNIDIGRFGIELLPPAVYLVSSYYERWLYRLENLIVQYGLADRDEIVNGHVSGPGRTDLEPFTASNAERVLARGSYVRHAARTALFAPGDRVRARNIHPRSHTRLPRYVRGRVGTIERVHEPNVFPDSVVRVGGEDPQWLYTVRFEGRELWGDDAEPGTEVSVEAFEPYLEPA